MITAIYSLTYVHGAELWLLFWAICTAVYLAACYAIRANRMKGAFKRVLIALLIAEVVVDLIWALIYYHNGVYLNYGIGAMYGLFIWIPILIIAGVAVTLKNKRHWEFR